MQARPRRFLAAAVGDCVAHPVAVRRQGEAAVLREHLAREVAEAAAQVLGGVQRQDGAGRVALEPQVGVLLTQPVQGRLAVGEIALEQRRRRRRQLFRLGRRLIFGTPGAEKQRQEVVAFAVGRTQPCIEAFRLLPGGDSVPCDPLLGLDVVDAHEGGRIADVPVRLLVLLGQHLEDARVAADRLVRALGHQVDDVRRPPLPVAVDPAVPLLEDHQRPRHVEVDEPVALIVKVDALGRDVGADQQTQRARRIAEVLDDALLVHVAQAAVEDLDLVVPEPQVHREPSLEPLQRFDALGEHDQAIVRIAGLPLERPAAADRGEQRLVLRVIIRTDSRESLPQDLQRFNFRCYLCAR